MDTLTPRLDILPAEQVRLWPQLRPIKRLGFVLYGGTAIALRLGHRKSVDFDFFTSRPVDRDALRRALPFLNKSQVQQDSKDTYEVVTQETVKVSFFGGLDFGRVKPPSETADGVMRVASLDDLMATKLKVILQRSAAKDYQDLAAMIRAGVKVENALAAAERMFKPTFPPAESLRAMVYFEGGDMARLAAADRKVLIEAAARVRELPSISIQADLSLHETIASPGVAPKIPPRIDPPSPGPRMRL